MSQKLSDVLDEIRMFVRRRDWKEYHDPKNLAMAVGSEAGELLELFRWVHSDQADRVRTDDERMRRIEDEVADVAICLFMLCDRLEIDLFDVVDRKLEANRKKYPAEDS